MAMNRRHPPEINLSAERLKSFLESAPDGMVVINQEGYIDFVNAQTEKIFGYERSELLGQKMELLISSGHEKPERDRAGFMKRFAIKAMRGGLELFGKTKEG